MAGPIYKMLIIYKKKPHPILFLQHQQFFLLIYLIFPLHIGISISIVKHKWAEVKYTKTKKTPERLNYTIQPFLNFEGLGEAEVLALSFVGQYDERDVTLQISVWGRLDSQEHMADEISNPKL